MRGEMVSGQGYIEFEEMTQISTHQQLRYHQAMRWLEEDSTKIKPAPASKNNISKPG